MRCFTSKNYGSRLISRNRYNRLIPFPKPRFICLISSVVCLIWFVYCCCWMGSFCAHLLHRTWLWSMRISSNIYSVSKSLFWFSCLLIGFFFFLYDDVKQSVVNSDIHVIDWSEVLMTTSYMITNLTHVDLFILSQIHVKNCHRRVYSTIDDNTETESRNCVSESHLDGSMNKEDIRIFCLNQSNRICFAIQTFFFY